MAQRRLILRIVLAAPVFGWAALCVYRSWAPLGDGYFADYKDSPDGVYVTMAAIALSVAAVLVALGLLIVWPAFRRWGFLLLAALAALAGVLPAVLFKWSSEPDGWPWVWLADSGYLGWIRLEQSPQPFHWVEAGVTMQVALAVITAAALVAHVLRTERHGVSVRVA